MDNYVIVTDSSLDLPPKIIENLGIDIMPMKYVINDECYTDGDLKTEDFYSQLRQGVLTSTTQINTEEFLEFFSKYLEEGKDVLYVGFSSGLSGTYNNAVLASNQLLEIYPNNKVRVVDSLSASIGQGLLIYQTVLKKREGYSLEQLEEWIAQNRAKVCHWFMVDDLYHLKRGGRVSSAVAIIGSVLNVKPLLFVDNEGKLQISEKARGRRKTFDLIISKLHNLNLDVGQRMVSICHGDCSEDAEYVAEKIKREFSVSDVIIESIGPVIGSHTGPGALGLSFFGNSR